MAHRQNIVNALVQPVQPNKCAMVVLWLLIGDWDGQTKQRRGGVVIALLKKLIKEAICKHEYAVLTEIENAAPYKSGVFVRVFACRCGKCGKTTFKVIG